MTLKRIGTTFAVAVLGLLLLAVTGPASAYAVPDEYKNQKLTDDELIQIAIDHPTEPWAIYLINDLGYRYNVRNVDQFKLRMAYQKTQPKIVRNNMVQGNN